jgi:hypothetical protein
MVLIFCGLAIIDGRLRGRARGTGCSRRAALSTSAAADG